MCSKVGSLFDLQKEVYNVGPLDIDTDKISDCSVGVLALFDVQNGVQIGAAVGPTARSYTLSEQWIC